MKSCRILLVGEPMCLFRSNCADAPLHCADNYSTGIAGAELNVAIGLTRLGHQAAYVTKVGNDPFGSMIIHQLEQMHISTHDISRSDTHRTGLVFKEKVTSGDPEIYYMRAGSAASTLSPADIDAIDLDGYDAIHMTGILPALSDNTRAAALRLKERALQQGILVSFDPNLRPQLWPGREAMRDFIHAFAAGCDLFFPGVAEAQSLTGLTDHQEILDYYCGLGSKTVIMKIGSKGALYQNAHERGQVPGYRVEVLDTVGAGDGFAAGTLSGLLEGLSLPEAIRRGNACGARQITVLGDNEGLPTREQLEDFFRTHEEVTV